MKIRLLQHPEKANLATVRIDDTFTLWFSYDTCIAIETPYETLITKASFSQTTARHKKFIKGELVDDAVFQQKMREYGFS
jgi:hypothetical protein